MLRKRKKEFGNDKNNRFVNNKKTKKRVCHKYKTHPLFCFYAAIFIRKLSLASPISSFPNIHVRLRFRMFE